MKGKDIAQFCLNTLKELGAEKAQAIYKHTVKKEMSHEGQAISLLRTLHKDEVTLKAISNHKDASFISNKITPEALQTACKEVITLMESSPEDPHKDIAPKQETKVFHHGEKEPNFEKMYERLAKFNDEVAKRYPKLIMRDSRIDHEYKTTYFLNSNGVDVETNKGSYTFWSIFTAKDGEKTSSFNYDMVTKVNLDDEFIDWGLVDKILSQTEKQTDLKPVPEKFEGDIVLTPLCLNSLANGLLEELQDGKHITKSSLLEGKLNERVLSDKLTIKSLPLSDEFAEKYYLTSDGFLAEDATVFDKGVLKTNLLSLYGANKTGQERAKNYGINLKVETGDKPLSEIIKSIKKGVLLHRLSSGRPAANGDFSGVAKNSFYIENGEIKHALNETMINTNILDIFKNIENISKESVNYGFSILPWVHSTGVTISGK